MKYTESHDWIMLEKDTAVIGITDYAQKELGEVVYVELPTIGHSVRAGDEVVVAESTKAAVDIYAPLSGTITDVNTSLKINPEFVNQASTGAGWLYRIRLTNPSELDSLMDETAYRTYISLPIQGIS